MLGSVKRGQIKPPSQEWYQFAEQAELEAQGDAAAGYAAEEFLPSFWEEKSGPQLNEASLASDTGSNGFMWFLAGLGFGTLLGVLYAPRSGRETREAIRSTAEEGKDYIRTRGREAREAVGTWVDRGKDVINRQKDQFTAAFEEGRKTYHEASGDERTKKS